MMLLVKQSALHLQEIKILVLQKRTNLKLAALVGKVCAEKALKAGVRPSLLIEVVIYIMDE